MQQVNGMGKAKNPDYLVVNGYVSKDVALQFRLKCVENQIEFSEGLEVALQWWLALGAPVTKQEKDK